MIETKRNKKAEDGMELQPPSRKLPTRNSRTTGHEPVIFERIKDEKNASVGTELKPLALAIRFTGYSKFRQRLFRSSQPHCDMRLMSQRNLVQVFILQL